jgi:hypothetical protein
LIAAIRLDVKDAALILATNVSLQLSWEGRVGYYRRNLLIKASAV